MIIDHKSGISFSCGFTTVILMSLSNSLCIKPESWAGNWVIFFLLFLSMERTFCPDIKTSSIFPDLILETKSLNLRLW